MSFVYNPTYFRLPHYPNIYNSSINGFWCGRGEEDNGYLVYLWNDRYVMTTGIFGNFIRIGTTNYTPSHLEVNGYVWYSGENNYLYYSKKYGAWVIHNKFPGYEPQEMYDNEKQAWFGDDFYTGFIPSAMDGAISNFSPRGGYRNGGSSKIATYYFPRWEKGTETGTVTGEYLPKEPNTGNKYFGIPRWRDNHGTYYIRSLAKVGSFFTYGTIHNVSGKWLIGDVGNASGWHEGSEPSKTGSITFLFKRNEGSTVSGYNLTLSLYDYMLGEERSANYLGEVAIWR